MISTIDSHASLRTRLTILGVLCLSAGLSACGTTDLVKSDKVDYRTLGAKSVTLDVPPDLSQLSTENRFGVPMESLPTPSARPSRPGITTASAGAVGTTRPVGIAPIEVGGVRLMRSGDDQWLAATQSPDVLWPKLKSFWTDNGFAIAIDDPAAGVIETDWAENRAKVKSDIIRRTIGRLFERLYDSGERDRYRLRVERTATGGSEITITHKGLEEVFINQETKSTSWRNRPADPELVSIMLSKLLVALGGPQDASPQPGIRAGASASDKRAATTSGGPIVTSGALTMPTKPSVDLNGNNSIDTSAASMASLPSSTVTLTQSWDATWKSIPKALEKVSYVVAKSDKDRGFLTVGPKSQNKVGQSSGLLRGLLDRIGLSDVGTSGDAQVTDGTQYQIQLIRLSATQTQAMVLEMSKDGPVASDNAKAFASTLAQSLQ